MYKEQLINQLFLESCSDTRNQKTLDKALEYLAFTFNKKTGFLMKRNAVFN